ncbi:MAG: hypothetical protein Q8O67_26785 [Deltaproteobacteria bacterium]|nr:hypothetical protein [Deltaproteobacteria bacterium]
MGLIDASGFPLVRLSFSAQLTVVELEEAVAATAAVFARGQRVAFIIDLSLLEAAMGVERRDHLARVMATIQKDADRLMLGAVYVTPSMVGRGVIVALNWARGKRPYPTVVVATVAEAEALVATWFSQ